MSSNKYHIDEYSQADLGTLKRSDKQVYELISRQATESTDFDQYHLDVIGALKRSDTEVYDLLNKEYDRQRFTLQLIAAENQCSKAVLAAIGTVVQNKTTEGFAGARYHGGCEVVDSIETLAIERAKDAFGAGYANVQPHSGTTANQIVLTAILQRDDKVLSLGLDQGGHLSHGAKASWAGKFFDIENYYVDKESFLLDYDAIEARAIQVGPKLIICGASAYPRAIDFKKFRQIADRVGAYLLADVSHIAGLIIAGAHQSPIDHAHFTTTSTYKPGGPRGGLILMGKDYNQKIKTAKGEKMLCELIEKTTFPGVQGTPYLNHIAAKAVFFKEAVSDEYRQRQFKIVENAESLAASLLNRGFDVLTGGTDSHMILVNVANFKQGLTGLAAQKALEDCGIIVNKNRLPYDTKKAAIASGIRIGTPVVTRNRMGTEQMDEIADMMDMILNKVEVISDSEHKIEEQFKAGMRERVKDFCSRFSFD